MSVQFLVNGVHPDGTPGLVAISRNEWLKILEDNMNLPKEQRRYFYRDAITDNNSHDYIFMEVPRDIFFEWTNQTRSTYRNFESQKNYFLLSYDELIEEGMDEPLDTVCVEDIVIDKVLTGEIEKAICNFAPWAPELFDMYLSGERENTISFLMERCHVVRQSANRYRKAFEDYIKKFLQN